MVERAEEGLRNDLQNRWRTMWEKGATVRIEKDGLERRIWWLQKVDTHQSQV